ncbi:hypothetical protein HHOHNEGG_00006 [Clostridium phage LPCPA6]|uniref:Uncharacterized protein n=1 Tax=Clostridium phage LPCPA6 TaxID=2924884 RepID=A0AAE9K864_9CAUD|nr:hypothetical protein PQC33_gp06 [Clostridium phage LPCPA6]UNY47183.1 hypothetical protein HHOHNEGG_00006 [Clostridium phage LPCPA6]
MENIYLDELIDKLRGTEDLEEIAKIIEEIERNNLNENFRANKIQYDRNFRA